MDLLIQLMIKYRVAQNEACVAYRVYIKMCEDFDRVSRLYNETPTNAGEHVWNVRERQWDEAIKCRVFASKQYRAYVLLQDQAFKALNTYFDYDESNLQQYWMDC